MNLTVLFQLIFNFIYNTFSKKFSVSTKLVANPCNACDCFKSNVNMFKFKHFSNFNY